MRILVIEDHPTLGNSLSEGLREEGYAVDLATDGETGLWRAQTEPYDCILLDLTLPRKDGTEILRTLRNSGRDCSILCLTARDALEDRVQGLDLGADDYMIKPFVWEELLARIRSVIRRRHGQSAAVLTIGDLAIDTKRRTVMRGDKKIALSAREYALLQYLAHRRGEVVSRPDIWEHIYDGAEETTSNVVDVYIGYLRK
ncbi:MAG: response regulator transcription factor, partial [Tepidisphaeraceae bacterium]